MPARPLIGLVIVYSIVSSALAQPATPVALVEEITGTSPDVEFMDYLSAGKVVRLAAGDKIVLSYLKSCWHETIVSGTVTIGGEKSEVANGTVERHKVACDGGKIQLSREQAQKSGAMTFRAGPKKGAQSGEIVLYGLSPVIEARGAVKMSIVRIDRPGENLEFNIAGPQLTRGAFFDLGKTGTALTAGGTYRIRSGTDEAVFKIAPFAKPGEAPVIGRLIRLKVLD